MKWDHPAVIFPLPSIKCFHHQWHYQIYMSHLVVSIVPTDVPKHHGNSAMLSDVRAFPDIVMLKLNRPLFIYRADIWKADYFFFLNDFILKKFLYSVSGAVIFNRRSLDSFMLYRFIAPKIVCNLTTTVYIYGVRTCPSLHLQMYFDLTVLGHRQTQCWI